MTKKTTAAAVAVEPSTDDLLRNLNDKRAEAIKEAEAAEEDNAKFAGSEPDVDGRVTVTLPEGSQKIIFLISAAVFENEHRSVTRGAKMVPEYLVYERQADGTRRHFHAFKYAGDTTPRIHKGSAWPCADWIPNRIPGTAGTSPAHFMAQGLQVYFESTGPVTITVDREALVATLQQAPVEKPVQRDPFAVAVPTLVTPGLAEAVETVSAAITAHSTGSKRGRAQLAAEHLKYLITPLAAIDSGTCVPRANSSGNVFGEIGTSVFHAADLTAAVALILQTLLSASSSQEAQNAGHRLVELTTDLRLLKA